jgi:hypothetical protein
MAAKEVQAPGEEAPDIIAAFTDLEHQLASPGGRHPVK